MACVLGRNFVVCSFFVLLFANLAWSIPISKDQEPVLASKAKVQNVKSSTPESQVTKGRTIMSSGMDFMKDMFDWGSVTWVPLGSLIFSKKDDNESIGFAKWPTSNRN